MLFKYKAVENGRETEGTIDALNVDVAIASLQRRNVTVVSLEQADKKSFLQLDITLFERVSNKDVVVLSRQIATLFGAQVSALRVFKLLSGESVNPVLGKKLTQVADELQAGSSISKALEKHPSVFSSFYVNMVRSGEESGKLDEAFMFLADYLDRNYELTSKAKNALIYPAFVMFTFVTVMALMLTLVIPRISAILIESGQDIPVYTQVVIGISDFLVNFWYIMLAVLVGGGYFFFRFAKTPKGKFALDQMRISIPYIGDLYRKLYLSRIADNLSTMIGSGIAIIRAMEVTSTVVDNDVFSKILQSASDQVKSGSSLSDALSPHKDIPGIMTQMIRVGEESGEMGSILKTLARFYSREVSNAVDTLVDLIEPVMIVLLGLGVGLLLAAVLIPIYNISSAI